MGVLTGEDAVQALERALAARGSYDGPDLEAYRHNTRLIERALTAARVEDYSEANRLLHAFWAREQERHLLRGAI